MRNKANTTVIDEDRLKSVGDALEGAVWDALAALEENGVSERDADEFVRDAVFNAWWGWDYGVLA